MNNCTCPSGDGSLRWPCPKHPPEILQTPGGWRPAKTIEELMERRTPQLYPGGRLRTEKKDERIARMAADGPLKGKFMPLWTSSTLRFTMGLWRSGRYVLERGLFWWRIS